MVIVITNEEVDAIQKIRSEIADLHSQQSELDEKIRIKTKVLKLLCPHLFESRKEG